MSLSCEFGVCGISEGFMDTVSASHPSELTCVLQGVVDGTLDLTGISMLPAANQDDWEWYYANATHFGLIYIGGTESELVSAITRRGKLVIM